MYNVKRPGYILAYVTSYDEEKRITYYKDIKKFDTQKELVAFLARYQKRVMNNDLEPIPGVYQNRYIDAQALCGVVNFESKTCGIYINTKQLYFVCPPGFMMLSPVKMIGRYIFMLDTKERPYFDVRLLKNEVAKVYESNIAGGHYYYNDRDYSVRKWKHRGIHPKKHKCYPWRDDAKYIHRARAAYGLIADEEEYKRFAKSKDKWFRQVWPDEDFSRHGNGVNWKDNSGSRERHQWERKAKRDFKKYKKNKYAVSDKYFAEDMEEKDGKTEI